MTYEELVNAIKYNVRARFMLCLNANNLKQQRENNNIEEKTEVVNIDILFKDDHIIIDVYTVNDGSKLQLSNKIQIGPGDYENAIINLTRGKQLDLASDIYKEALSVLEQGSLQPYMETPEIYDAPDKRIELIEAIFKIKEH